jgi:hypothetical protein
MEAEQRQDGHDHDEKTDEINNSIHDVLLVRARFAIPRVEIKIIVPLAVRAWHLDREARCVVADFSAIHQDRRADEKHQHRADHDTENPTGSAATISHDKSPASPID